MQYASPFHAVRMDAAQARGLLIATHGIQMPSDYRPAEKQPGERRQQDEQDRRDRRLAPQGAELFVVHIELRRPCGHLLNHDPRQAAQPNQRGQRRHEWRQADDRNHPGV